MSIYLVKYNQRSDIKGAVHRDFDDCILASPIIQNC